MLPFFSCSCFRIFENMKAVFIVLGTFCIMAVSWTQHVYKGKPLPADATGQDTSLIEGQITSFRLQPARYDIPDSTILYTRVAFASRWLLRNSRLEISSPNVMLLPVITGEDTLPRLRQLSLEDLSAGRTKVPMVFKHNLRISTSSDGRNSLMESSEYTIGNEYVSPRNSMVAPRDRECFSVIGVATHTLDALISPLLR